MAPHNIKVEVAYARPDKQVVIPLEIPDHQTIEYAIRASTILTLFPEIDLEKQPVGVFSVVKKLTDPVYEGDRIEIYRPLLIDPKEARRKREKLQTKSTKAQRSKR